MDSGEAPSADAQDGTAEKDWPVWAPAFLTALAELGVVTTAAKAADVGRRTVYHLRESDPSFAAAWDAAMEEAADVLETEARRRALEGWDEPVFGSGGTGVGTVQVGTIRRFSDTLLIFTLKGLRPEKYRERFDQKLSGALDINAAILEAHKAITGGS